MQKPGLGIGGVCNQHHLLIWDLGVCLPQRNIFSAFNIDTRTSVPTSLTAVRVCSHPHPSGNNRKPFELWDFTHLQRRKPVGISDEALTPDNIIVSLPRLLVYTEEGKFAWGEKIGAGYWGWEGEGKAS